MQDISELPLYIDDTGGISIAQIAARSRRLKREKKIGLIVIDYLQLIAPSRRAENRVQEMTEVTKGLKTLAKELDVPVLALSQLSRAVENARRQAADAVGLARIRFDRTGRRRRHVRLSRGILSEVPRARPSPARSCEMDGEVRAAHGRAELMIEKHRHGATKSLDLQFDERYTRFSDLAKDVMPPPR